MKLILFVSFLALASCEPFDWSNIRPLSEIREWREAHPNIDVIRQAHPSRSSRILEGDIAAGSDYPYIVGVQLHFDTGNSWCGASLISVNFALTAANCVFIVPSATVILGASNMFDTEAIRRIPAQAIHVHPEYSNSESLNDIATLHLSQPATLSNTIGIVRLPNRRQIGSTFVGQEAIVAGWGRTSSTGVQPVPTQFLRVLRIPIITNAACLIRYPAFITGSNICSNPASGTPCEGDEGGPLMIQEADGQRTQIGVFSYQFSLGCGLGWPAVYARVTSFLDFIGSHSDVIIRDDW